MLNGKALVLQITQRWKISIVTTLPRDHFTLTLRKQMKGNLIS